MIKARCIKDYTVLKITLSKKHKELKLKIFRFNVYMAELIQFFIDRKIEFDVCKLRRLDFDGDKRAKVQPGMFKKTFAGIRMKRLVINPESKGNKDEVLINEHVKKVELEH